MREKEKKEITAKVIELEKKKRKENKPPQDQVNSALIIRIKEAKNNPQYHRTLDK